MNRDVFEFNPLGMTPADRFWRVVLLVVCIGVVMLDLFFWRP